MQDCFILHTTNLQTQKYNTNEHIIMNTPINSQKVTFEHLQMQNSTTA